MTSFLNAHRRARAFAQRDDEDVYELLTRQFHTLSRRDLVHLYLIRDEIQRGAIELAANLRMVMWTRALAFGTVILGVLTVTASLIVS